MSDILASKLDPRRLIELLRIAENGSYTRAAAVQGVSQPALSNSMAILERMLGVKLLSRTRHGARLTEFGSLLAGHAAALDSVLKRAANEIELKKRGLQGVLIIGISPIASVDIVPVAVARLRDEAPDISVQILELPDDELLSRLRAGRMDVTISPTGPLTDPPDIERALLARDTMVLAMRSGHPLARRRSLGLADLRGQQWVMPDDHTTMWRQIEALFALDSEPWPATCVATNSLTALKSLLLCSDAVSIASARLIRLDCEAGRLATVPLRAPVPAREICLRWRRSAGLSPVAQRFVVMVNAVAKESQGKRSRRSIRRDSLESLRPSTAKPAEHPKNK